MTANGKRSQTEGKRTQKAEGGSGAPQDVPRAGKDEALAVALAAGETQKDAAALANTSPRTVHRRLQDPSFRALVRQRRNEIADQAVGRVTKILVKSIDTCEEMLESGHVDSTRLRAAQILLSSAMKMRTTELEERLWHLEELVREHLPEAAEAL